MINAARDVTKTNTSSVETFRAPELGVLGYIVASEFDVSGLKEFPKVDILFSYIQPSTVALQALVASGAQGIVSAGSGAVGLSGFEKAALQSLVALPARTRPVLVRSTRVGNGRVSGCDELDALGMIPADNLNPQKARILLMLALTRTSDLKEIQRMFAEY